MEVNVEGVPGGEWPCRALKSLPTQTTPGFCDSRPSPAQGKEGRSLWEPPRPGRAELPQLPQRLLAQLWLCPCAPRMGEGCSDPTGGKGGNLGQDRNVSPSQ